MTKSKHFFQTLHDESGPVGTLGRGTHYSVFRAVVFHDTFGKPLSDAQFSDFAVIWDEDHDERVLSVVDSLYQKGLLPAFAFFGERKGRLTAIPSEGIHDEARLSFIEAKLQSCCNFVAGDSWTCSVVPADDPNNGIIDDDKESVELYLKCTSMLWQLGVKKSGSA